MKKQTLIMFGVLVVLVGLAYIYQGPVKKWQDNFGKPKNIIANVDFKSADKFIIAKQGETVLEKKDGEWYVGGSKFKVSKPVMDEFYSKLEAASKAELDIVSNNKSKKTDFETDSSNGVVIKAFKGDKQIASLVVGKVASDYESSYVSQNEIDSTYLFKGVNLSYVFDKSEWRDTAIFSTDQKTLTRIRFQYPKLQFAVKLEGDKWVTEGAPKITLNKTKVEQVLSLMANLNAVEIPKQDFKVTGLEKNAFIVEASGGGIKNTLMIGNDNGKGSFYAKTGDSDNIYLISKSDRDALDQRIEKLK